MSDSLWLHGLYGAHGAHQVPLPMGFASQEYWSRLLFPSPGKLPNSEIKPLLLLGRQNLYHWTTCEALINASVQSVQSLSHVWLFATPWNAAHQASLSTTNSRSLLKLMPIESVMPSSHLILCHPLLLLPPNPPSIRVFSNESTLCMRWPKYWSFSFSILGFPYCWDMLDLSSLPDCY